MTELHRNTIFVEDAEILDHQAFDSGQWVMRLRAPKCAARASAGSFVHLQCDPSLRMRRPFSIMRASKTDGWIEVFYKTLGTGTRLLSCRKQGERLSAMGPIGVPFVCHPQRPRPLLLGGGVGMPPMIFLSEQLKRNPNFDPLVLLGSEIPFPFKARPSKMLVSGMPDGVIAAMPLLEDWSIPSRLTSQQGYSGCFDGLITELARIWLAALGMAELAKVEIFACGPRAMLAAVSNLARDLLLPAQVSLEEYMACAVGGCAGCTVEVQTPQGPAMKRVCVDGPVFDANSAFPRDERL